MCPKSLAISALLSGGMALGACAAPPSRVASNSAQPAQVTTYEESHPHPEYNLTYAAVSDTHTADADKIPVRKGACVWFKSAAGGATQEARLENGTIHLLAVADFYKVVAEPVSPAGGDTKKAAE